MLDVIEQKIVQHSGNIKICQKWLWLMNYIKVKINSFAENRKHTIGGIDKWLTRVKHN